MLNKELEINDIKESAIFIHLYFSELDNQKRGLDYLHSLEKIIKTLTGVDDIEVLRIVYAPIASDKMLYDIQNEDLKKLKYGHAFAMSIIKRREIVEYLKQLNDIYTSEREQQEDPLKLYTENNEKLVEILETTSVFNINEFARVLELPLPTKSNFIFDLILNRLKYVLSR